MKSSEEVILVDERDNEIGSMEKMEAHRKGLLHRALSVILVNSRGELLLQKRSLSKYHSPGLWTNTCCSHPRPGEAIARAAKRRLLQEMGIDLLPDFSYKFIYKVTFNNGLIENELDHVFRGRYDGEPRINPDEAMDWRYEPLDSIKSDVQKNPHLYTEWFKIMLSHPQLEAAVIR